MDGPFSAHGQDLGILTNLLRQVEGQDHLGGECIPRGGGDRQNRRQQGAQPLKPLLLPLARRGRRWFDAEGSPLVHQAILRRYQSAGGPAPAGLLDRGVCSSGHTDPASASP